MRGILINGDDRPDVALCNGALYGGLHCGEVFNLKISEGWQSVRLEFNGDWILVCKDETLFLPYGTEIEI
jgi:hypothetical protein